MRGAVTSGGVGIEVRQDASSLQFIVESVAPSGAAGAAGVRQGDVITMVGGKGCVDASGLSKLEVEGILSLQGKGEGQTGGWGDWLGGRSSHAVRRIAAVAPPQKGTHDPKAREQHISAHNLCSSMESRIVGPGVIVESDRKFLVVITIADCRARRDERGAEGCAVDCCHSAIQVGDARLREGVCPVEKGRHLAWGELCLGT